MLINKNPASSHRLPLVICTLFAVSRITVLGFGYLGYRLSHSSATIYHIFCQWDCGWYNSLISDGYDSKPASTGHEGSANWAFLPLFPFTLRYAREFLSFFERNSDFLVVNGFFLCSLFVLYRYYRLNNTRENSLFCLLLIAFSPYGVYFSVPYTESLSLLLTLLVFYYASTDKWINAGLFAALLSATKVIGVFIVIPMLVIALRSYHFRSLLMLNKGTEKVVFSLTVAPLGLFLYMLFLYHYVGDIFAFKNVQVAWARPVSNPFTVLFNGLRNPFHIRFYFALVSLTGLGLATYLLRHRKYPEATLLGIGILIPLSTQLAAMPRFIFGLFPVYISIELLTRGSPTLRYLVLAVFAASSVLITIAWTNSIVYVN